MVSVSVSLPLPLALSLSLTEWARMCALTEPHTHKHLYESNIAVIIQLFRYCVDIFEQVNVKTRCASDRARTLSHLIRLISAYFEMFIFHLCRNLAQTEHIRIDKIGKEVKHKWTDWKERHWGVRPILIIIMVECLIYSLPDFSIEIIVITLAGACCDYDTKIRTFDSTSKQTLDIRWYCIIKIAHNSSLATEREFSTTL